MKHAKIFTELANRIDPNISMLDAAMDMIANLREESLTNGTTIEKSLTYEDIYTAIKHIPTDTIAKLMTDLGFDPAAGGKLVIPSSMDIDFGALGRPNYILISNLIDTPLLLNTANVGLTI